MEKAKTTTTKKSVTKLLPGDPETGSASQRMIQITPSSRLQSLYGPFTEEVDLVILVDSFQLRLLCDSVFSPRVSGVSVKATK